MSDSLTPLVLPLLEWIDIPAGQVTLSDHPDTFDIKPFKIAKYPVTNAQYDAFIQDKGYKQPLWWHDLGQAGGSPRASDWRDPDAPKLEVTWYEAVAFCRWLSDQIGLDVRLPTEWEWQWAAVGGSGWLYPYGEVFDSSLCNTKESGLGRTNLVTDYAEVKSHFGVVDMAGNVWEWCLNEGPDLQNIQTTGDANRVIRGGSWNDPAVHAQATFRRHRTPRTRTFNIGFRVIAVDEP
jgi:formylglycine-generating enzyme required for sulfatase activity